MNDIKFIERREVRGYGLTLWRFDCGAVMWKDFGGCLGTTWYQALRAIAHYKKTWAAYRGRYVK